MLEVLRGSSGIDNFVTLVTYMFRVIDPLYQAELRAKIGSLDPHAKETAMTIADLLHEEGRAEGRREGSISTLRSLLLLKFRLPSLDADHESRLRAATPEVLDRYLRRVLVAETLTGVFDESRLPISRMKGACRRSCERQRRRARRRTRGTILRMADTLMPCSKIDVRRISECVEIAQDRIDLFAKATEDFQRIHIDTERANRSPFCK